ncbi:NYN domain-containing protein [Candidatus Shapirobacteria bacterium]|nr:NYN domain-containing protein [Candidatus Shapirobacteria bacterium]
MEKRTILFVDGTNLYAGQYQLFGPKKYLNFKCLIAFLERSIKTSFSHIYFYASYSPKTSNPTKKEKAYLKNEALFYRNVKSVKNLTFFKGYRSKTSGKEKEVDVKLAVDIADFSHRNKFEKLFLWSGDADFMHALKIAQNLGKEISIIALENRIPYRFSYHYPVYLICFDKNQGLKRNRRRDIKKLAVGDREDFLIKI